MKALSNSLLMAGSVGILVIILRMFGMGEAYISTDAMFFAVFMMSLCATMTGMFVSEWSNLPDKDELMSYAYSAEVKQHIAHKRQQGVLNLWMTGISALGCLGISLYPVFGLGI